MLALFAFQLHLHFVNIKMLFFQYLNLYYITTAREMLIRKSKRLMSTITRICSVRGGKQRSDEIHCWLPGSQTTLTLVLRLLYMISAYRTYVTQKLSLRSCVFAYCLAEFALLLATHLCAGKVKMWEYITTTFL